MKKLFVLSAVVSVSMVLVSVALAQTTDLQKFLTSVILLFVFAVSHFSWQAVKKADKRAQITGLLWCTAILGTLVNVGMMLILRQPLVFGVQDISCAMMFLGMFFAMGRDFEKSSHFFRNFGRAFDAWIEDNAKKLPQD